MAPEPIRLEVIPSQSTENNVGGVAGVPSPRQQNTAQTTDRPSNSSGGPSKRTRKISDIKNKLLRPALTSHYICKFHPPTPVSNWTEKKGTPFNPNQDLIEISCSEAALPGSSLMTHDITSDYTGVSEKHAYRRAYDERASFTFIVDHDYTIIKFFENWMSYIVGEQFASQNGRPGIEDPNYFYRVRYPKDYQTDNLYITKFERDYENTGVCLEYKFIKAYPLSIVTMPVRYDTSELLKCTVNFTYSRYVINPTETAQQTPQLQTGLGIPPKKTQRKETTNPGNTYGPGSVFTGRDSATGVRNDGIPEPDPITYRQELGLDPL
jgi:hypothetical protein